MSARPEIKRIIFFVTLLVLLVLGLMIFGLWNSESASKLKKYWRVEEISFEGESILHEFKTKSLSFLDNDELLLPNHKSTKVTLPIKYSKWKYKRRGLFDGIVEVKDLKQSIFDGKYEIEILDHREPQLIKLASDKIEIYLRGRKRLTIENPTIEMDFGIDSIKSVE